MRNLCIASILLIFYVSTITAKTLPVGVYYEAFCPDSVEFVKNQLYPSFQKIGKYVDLELIPYGFASSSNSTGHLKFKCQHGPKECYNNKIHSCLLANYSMSTSLTFINCAMYEYPLKKCADQSNIPWSFFKECLSSGRADELLLKNGEKTKAVSPPIKYIPTITVDGVENKKAEHNFLPVVCEYLKNKPDACKNLGFKLNTIM